MQFYSANSQENRENEVSFARKVATFSRKLSSNFRIFQENKVPIFQENEVFQEKERFVFLIFLEKSTYFLRK